MVNVKHLAFVICVSDCFDTRFSFTCIWEAELKGQDKKFQIMTTSVLWLFSADKRYQVLWEFKSFNFLYTIYT